MTRFGRIEIQKAIDQITNHYVSVKLPRLSEEEIAAYTRPKKRNARKRYHTLSFDTFDDEKFFEITCIESMWYSEKKKKVSCRNKKLEEVKSKIQHTLDDKKQEKNLILKQIIESDESISSTNVTSISQLDTKFILKVNDKLISKSENSTRSCDNITSEEIYDSRIECDEKLNSEMYTKVNNSLIGKIRVKTPAELGSTVIFIDKSEDLSGILLPTTDVSFQNYFSDLIINTDDADKTENSISVEKLNIQLISKLYKKFFTLENQTKIKKVAELLQNLNENIKRKIDRLVEIKKDNKSTEAEKLMLRHQAHGQFNRVRESNEAALKEQFDIFGKIFDDENFQILFQLLFLGILKMFIVSVSNKKGTLFKTIVNLLLQSLSNSGYKDERIFNLLKSKSFRDECIAIVQFIEKFKETKFFGMLFLSESDKINMLKRINGNHNNELLEIDSENNSCSTKNNTISTDLSVNTSNLPIVSCGSNLLLQPHDKLQNISLSIEQNSMSDTLNSTLLQNINKKLKCTDSITDNIKDVQLCKQSAVIETNHIPFNNNLQFCQNVILNKLNYTGVKFMPNVKISQKASLNMNFSTNTLVLSGTQIPQNTLIIDTQQRQVHTNSVPSVNNVCVSNSAIAHTNMNSSKNLSSVHTPNNSNNIPIMNYTQFQQNNSNCNITNGNESQVPLNSIAAIVETGSNTNLFERKTYGPAKGSNPKIVHQHSESASKTNEQLVNYKQSNNSHQYVTGIKKGSRLLINNSQINICKIHSNKSVDGNINIDNLPHFRVTSKNNENIQPDSILTTKLNKNHENMKTKNCNSTNYVTTNSNNHTNLRSLLSNSTSSVNQNMSTEYITMNRNASDRESNLVLPQTNAIFTVTSDNGNSMIKVNDSLLNSSCMNNYSNCWDKSSVSKVSTSAVTNLQESIMPAQSCAEFVTTVIKNKNDINNDIIRGNKKSHKSVSDVETKNKSPVKEKIITSNLISPLNSNISSDISSLLTSTGQINADIFDKLAELRRNLMKNKSVKESFGKRKSAIVSSSSSSTNKFVRVLRPR